MPSDALPEHYSFPYKVRTVAVIGAGATGAPAARQLRDHGLDVKVFERQAVSGGVWNWSPEIAPPLSVPTPPPSRGAFTPVLPDDVGPQKTSRPHGGDQRARWEFSPPNPVYWSLSNNVPTSTMAVRPSYPPLTPVQRLPVPARHTREHPALRDSAVHPRLCGPLSSRKEHLVQHQSREGRQGAGRVASPVAPDAAEAAAGRRWHSYRDVLD